MLEKQSVPINLATYHRTINYFLTKQKEHLHRGNCPGDCHEPNRNILQGDGCKRFLILLIFYPETWNCQFSSLSLWQIHLSPKIAFCFTCQRRPDHISFNSFLSNLKGPWSFVVGKCFWGDCELAGSYMHSVKVPTIFF